MSFQLSIVSPTGKILDDTVDSISVPGTEGGFAVYSKHMPLIATLQAGQARVRKDGQVSSYEITSGILEVSLKHNVLLLADQAVLLP